MAKANQKRFDPNDFRQLLFQGSMFKVTDASRFLPQMTEGDLSDGEHLVLEDTRGAYYMLPRDVITRYRLPWASRDELEKALGGEKSGYGHFNPHHLPQWSLDEFETRVNEALGGPDFYQGGLFAIPEGVNLPAAIQEELAQSENAGVALVIQDTQGNYYVTPTSVLRRHVVPSEMRSILDKEVGVLAPHDTW